MNLDDLRDLLIGCLQYVEKTHVLSDPWLHRKAQPGCETCRLIRQIGDVLGYEKEGA